MPIRRGSLAVTPMVERVILRRMLVERFVADPEFASALQSLFETQVQSTQVGSLPELPRWLVLEGELQTEVSKVPVAGIDADVAAYVGAVRSLATRWGLDRLVDPRPERGATLIHDWCRSCRRAGRIVSVRSLVDGLTQAEYVAEIGEVVARSVTDLGDLRVVDEVVRPVVRIEVVDTWNPLVESRASAGKRLRALAGRAIQQELDRLTADAESKGYRFPDRAPALDRDLDRLFRLMAQRASADDLIAEAGTGPDTVDAEAAVIRSLRRIADRTGVSTSGWKLTRR